jgi:chemotaxis protein methyltransferase CheR
LELKVFKDLLRERTGLIFDASREELLEREISRALARTSVRSRSELYGLLLGSETEMMELVKNLTVNETFFFREPAYLELFSGRLVSEIRARKGPLEKIKVLSAGCSSGEEPYTIAMSLMERYGKGIGHVFSITGVDIDTDAIETARRGVYGKLSFRGVSNATREKYFKCSGKNRYSVKEHLREVVDFGTINLVCGEFLEKLRGIDVIFYRNVSIYFDQASQKRIFDSLASILNPGGYMILASSETLTYKDMKSMRLVGMDGLFIYQKAENEDVAPAKEPQRTRKRDKFHLKPSQPSWKLPERAKAQTAVTVEASEMSAGRMLEDALSLYRLRRYADALTLVDDIIGIDQGLARAHELKGGILLNLNRPEEAEHACLKAVETDHLSLEGYMILGLISKLAGDSARAVSRFQKALYVEPSCWLAHFHLAEICGSVGEHEKAAKHYENVLRAIDRVDGEPQALSLFPLSFRKDDIMHLCRKKITDLKVS